MRQLLVFSDPHWDFVYRRRKHPHSRLAERLDVVCDQEPVYDASRLAWLEVLMPQPDRVARRASPALRVFRDDDATPDGTCVRDHVHVMDPAEAPVAALVTVLDEAGHGSINIGIGIGTSVQELVDTYTCASGRALLFSIVGCPAGDVGSCCAEPQLAHEALHWPATRKLPQMFEDAYRHVDGATQ